jgi:hypothetical protein
MVGVVLTGLWGFFVSDYYECSYNEINYIEENKVMNYTTSSDMRRNVLLFLVLKRSSVEDFGLILDVLTLLEYEDEDVKMTLQRNSTARCSPNSEFCEPV